MMPIGKGYTAKQNVSNFAIQDVAGGQPHQERTIRGISSQQLVVHQ
jgi:hypothetical protein